MQAAASLTISRMLTDMFKIGSSLAVNGQLPQPVMHAHALIISWNTQKFKTPQNI